MTVEGREVESGELCLKKLDETWRWQRIAISESETFSCVETFETTNWKEIFSQYGSKMLLFARQFAANQSDAEDIVQEAFTRFWKSDRRDDGNAVSLLFGCVRWAALDFLRRNQRRQKRENLASEYDRTLKDCQLFESSVEKEELSESVQAALKELPEAQREVVVLKIWGELTYAQISETLGIPANTASSRYRYALAALKRKMGNDCYA